MAEPTAQQIWAGLLEVVEGHELGCSCGLIADHHYGIDERGGHRWLYEVMIASPGVHKVMHKGEWIITMATGQHGMCAWVAGAGNEVLLP